MKPSACPNCGCTDPEQLEKFLEPVSPIAEEAQQQRDHGTKYFCGQCGRTWVVQRLPFPGPQP